MSLKKINRDIWNVYDHGFTIVIYTNGFVKKSGECVMGRGLAKDAKDRFPEFPKLLGDKLNEFGNKTFCFNDYRIITFPTKYNWWGKSNLKVIDTSANKLKKMLANFESKRGLVFMPWLPGIGNGKLDENDVKPIMEKYFDESKQVIFVEK